MTRVRLCDSCLILNKDYESGHDCNLRYSTSYERIRDNYRAVVNISGDCKLERIVVEGKTIIPDSIDIDGGLALNEEKSK